MGTSFLKETQGFEFKSENTEMICPEGHTMRRYDMAGDIYNFSLPVATCRACPRFSTCVTGSQKKNTGKLVRMSKYQQIYDAVLEQEKDPAFKKALRERMWKIEGLFAEAKNFHGLRRAHLRGRWKVQAQVYMISVVQNLKRLVGAGILDPISFLAELFFADRQKTKILAAA